MWDCVIAWNGDFPMVIYPNDEAHHFLCRGMSQYSWWSVGAKLCTRLAGEKQV